MRERLIPLEGAMNCRDLGGYAAEDGRRVRWDRLYRSDGLDKLTAADRARLAQLGLRTVVDLRSHREVGNAPSLLDGIPALEHHHFPVGGDGIEQRDFVEAIIAGEVAEFREHHVVASYIDMLVAQATTFGEVVTMASEAQRLPMLFHCTAGKDRTGLAALLVLGALGVADDDVLDDYELTTTYRSAKRVEELRPRLESHGVDVEAVRPMLTAMRVVMEATLGELRREWGSIEGYLTGPALVAEPTLAALQANLTEPA